MSQPANWQYEAFISYRHASSSAFARDLELQLKRYAKGWFSKPDRIFRDEQFLQAGKGLAESIREALTNTKYLVLLASPDAAQSRWVQDELDMWCREFKRTEQLIIVLTAGTIDIDTHTKQINWANTNALPQQLKEHLHTVPLYIDLSWAKEKEQRSLGNNAYKSAINAIAAAIRDTTPNALNGQEWRIRRRNQRVAWSTAAVLSVLLVAVVIGAFILRQTNLDLQRSIRLATSRELAATSQLQSMPQSLQTAANALALNQNPESVFALLNGVSQNQTLYAHVAKLPFGIETLRNIPGTDTLYAHAGTHAFVWHAASQKARAIPLAKQGLAAVQLLPNGRMYGNTFGQFWRLDSLQLLFEPNAFISAVKLNASGKNAFIALSNGEIGRLNLASGQFTKLFTYPSYGINSLVSHGPWVACAATGGAQKVVLYNTATDSLVFLPGFRFDANALAFSPNGKTLAVGVQNGNVRLFAMQEFKEIGAVKMEYGISDLAFNATNDHLAAADRGGFIRIINAKGVAYDGWRASNKAIGQVSWSNNLVYAGGVDTWVRSWLPGITVGFERLHPPVQHFFAMNKQWLGTNGNNIIDLQSRQVLKAFDTPIEVLHANNSGILLTQANGLAYVNPELNQVKAFGANPAGHRLVSASLANNGTYAVAAWWPLRAQMGSANGKVAIWQLGTDSVRWLEKVPQFPKAIALYNNELLALGGRGKTMVYNALQHRLLAQSDSAQYRMVEGLAFLDKDRLFRANLQGQLEIVYTQQPDSILKVNSTALPRGFGGMQMAGDTSFLCVDGSGIKWLGSDLTYYGTVVSTQFGRSNIKAMALAQGRLLAQEQSNAVYELTFDFEQWAAQARRAARVQFNFDSLAALAPVSVP